MGSQGLVTWSLKVGSMEEARSNLGGEGTCLARSQEDLALALCSCIILFQLQSFASLSGP